MTEPNQVDRTAQEQATVSSEQALQRHLELRQEIQSWIAEAGTPASRPLDLERFLREARRRSDIAANQDN